MTLIKTVVCEYLINSLLIKDYSIVENDKSFGQLYILHKNLLTNTSECGKVAIQSNQGTA